MPPTQIVKLRAHASRLLDLFIEVKERHAILRPMLQSEDVRRVFAAGRRARGFGMLQNTLGMACVLDFAKLAADSDKRTPSIKRLVEALGAESLTDQLREDFAVLNLVPKSGYSQEVLDLLADSERRDEAARRQQFDQLLEDVRRRWASTVQSRALTAFLTIRDKHLAHSELHFSGDKYRPLDLAGLGLKWQDLSCFVDELQPQIDALTLIYRGASFAFDMLQDQVTEAADDFWDPSA